MELMLIIVWVVLAIAVAILADRKGRSGVLWFLLAALLISPLLALILLAVLPDLTVRERDAQRTPCPMCAEPIPREARLCPHCQSTLPARWDRAPRDVVRRAIQRRSIPPVST